MSESRTKHAMRNFFSSVGSTIINTILSFLSRTVFIYVLGNVYLGLNSLFTNIIGMLSLAEMGIGIAISFSLYKPLAEKNYKEVQGIINFYRTAYRIVAIVVGIIGIAIIPFISSMTKGTASIDHIYFIYVIFLFNTVSSYLITYKTTLLNADQKTYLITNINIVIKSISIVVQIIVLLIFKNYILYLMVDCVIQLIGKLYLNYFINKKYPYIKEKNNIQLPTSKKMQLLTKVKALLFHQVGSVAINQTDSIITSIFISVETVGLVSNYNLLISTINTFVTTFFSSATAGLGNIIATETVDNQRRVYKNYDFLSFWIFGWTSICLFFLLSPFIKIWIGDKNLIGFFTVTLLCLNYYLTGRRVPLGNIKAAAGIYEQDRYIPIIQALVNIVVSIYCAKRMGLVGIYIGTFVSSLIPNINRPIVVYKYIFHESSRSYFIDYFKQLLLIIVNVIFINFIIMVIKIQNVYLNFIFISVLCLFLPNIIFVLVYQKNESFKYVINLVKSVFFKLKENE